MEQRLIDGNLVFEYIQKEKAWKQGTQKQPRYDKGKYDAYYEMLGIIKNSPTIDPIYAAGACYCRECERYKPAKHAKDAGTCYKKQGICKANDFCSHGERRIEP